MARRRGRGSSRRGPEIGFLHTAPLRTPKRTMLTTAKPSPVVCLVLLFAFAWIPTPPSQAQNTTDDVHISPRTEPPPAKDKGAVEDPALRTHTKPFKSDVDLVLVPVTITDPMNRLVTGLDRENFNVFEGKDQQDIKTFS